MSNILNRNAHVIAFGLAVLAIIAPSHADTIELKNGSALEGKYVGGTATTVNIETAQGVLAVQTSDVLSLKFSPALASVAAPAPAATGPVSVPAGSVLVVRMDSQVSSKDRAGTKFSGKLIGDLMAGNVVIAKAGSTVVGQVDESKQAGRLAGKSKLAISLSGIDMGGGKLLPIMTTNFAESGQGEFKKTARNMAGGALIGNAIDSSGGAGKGAAVGAGVSLIKKGDAVTVPPGAILEFRLSAPVNLPAAP